MGLRGLQETVETTINAEGSEVVRCVLAGLDTYLIYNTAFGSVLGSHLLSHSVLLTSSANADLDSMAGAGFKGASSNWAWTDTYLSLLSEIQVYGSGGVRPLFSIG